MKKSKRKPVYLIAGGPGTGRRKIFSLFREVFKEFGVESPCVAYIGAASGDNPEFFRWLSGMLCKAGAGKVVLAPVTGGRDLIGKAGEVLKSADVIFVSGGDVEKGMELLCEAGLIPLLQKLFAKGIPFFGLSAGSIMLAKSWVRWRDPDDDSTAELFPCLGFAPVLCDTHGEDEGWTELHALLKLAGEGAVGYGITSSAALCVTPDGKVRTIGGEVHRFTSGNKRQGEDFLTLLLPGVGL